MIDPHVHCRDWNWAYKDTVAHVLSVAERIGISGIFDMPNTEPVIASYDAAGRRLDDALRINSPVFYGLYVGLTSDPKQIKEAVRAWKSFFSDGSTRVGVVGLKLFAGKSVGDLSVVNEEDQKTVYRVLAEEGFSGVLAVHCEKESEMLDGIWDPYHPIPIAHCRARPSVAEYASVLDQIKFSGEVDFKGCLHIAHVSSNLSILAIKGAKEKGRIISCGVTPHHLLFDETKMMESDGILYKVNPPIRDCAENMLLWAYLKDGYIDWIETDHAPHTLAEKTGKVLDKSGKPSYASGIPSLVFYPYLLNRLAQEGFTPEQIVRITHRNIEDIFGINLPMTETRKDFKKIVGELCKEYDFFRFEQ
jgi:dihydroorotase